MASVREIIRLQRLHLMHAELGAFCDITGTQALRLTRSTQGRSNALAAMTGCGLIVRSIVLVSIIRPVAVVVLHENPGNRFLSCKA